MSTDFPVERLTLNENHANENLIDASEFHQEGFQYVLVGTELDRPARIKKLRVRASQVGQIIVSVRKLRATFFQDLFKSVSCLNR